MRERRHFERGQGRDIFRLDTKRHNVISSLLFGLSSYFISSDIIFLAEAIPASLQVLLRLGFAAAVVLYVTAVVFARAKRGEVIKNVSPLSGESKTHTHTRITTGRAILCYIVIITIILILLSPLSRHRNPSAEAVPRLSRFLQTFVGGDSKTFLRRGIPFYGLLVGKFNIIICIIICNITRFDHYGE